jgi:hypothetical protein
MEHDERAKELDREAEELSEQSERLSDRIEDTREGWEAKESDSSVPGAQPDPDSEETRMERKREESDQLPEEAPSEQVHDDESGGARDEAERTPGVPGEEERGTGQPADREEHGEQ